MAEDNYKYLLDKTIETQNRTSKKLIRNLLFQLSSIVIAFGLSYDISVIKDLMTKLLLIKEPDIILSVLPIFLIYLFIEFGFLLSLFISCVITKSKLVKKLLENVNTQNGKEVDLTEFELKAAKLSLKGTHIFEPMAGKQYSESPGGILNTISVVITFILMIFNNFFTIIISGVLLSSFVFNILVPLYTGIAITFYLIFGFRYRENNRIFIAMWVFISILLLFSILMIYLNVNCKLPDLTFNDFSIC